MALEALCTPLLTGSSWHFKMFKMFKKGTAWQDANGQVSQEAPGSGMAQDGTRFSLKKIGVDILPSSQITV